jgi:ornithine decarboxylase
MRYRMVNKLRSFESHGFLELWRDKAPWIRMFLQELDCSNTTDSLLIMDGSHIEMILGYFKRFLGEFKIYYAVKANSSAPILDFLNCRGISFDVASTGEIKQVQTATTREPSLIFSNPIKSQQAIEMLFKGRISSCTVDCLGDIERIAQFRTTNGITWSPDIFIRIKVRSRDVQIDLNEKFGCSEEEALEILRRCHRSGLHATGITFHVGTQSYRTENYAQGITASMKLAEQASQQIGITIDKINIGGGFPDSIHLANNNSCYEEYFLHLRRACEPALEKGFVLCCEPGRILVSCAGTLISTILDTRVRDGKRWIYLNDGIYGTFSGKYFDHKHFYNNFFPVSPRQLDQTESVVVAGPTCDSIDLIEWDVPLPNSLRYGDQLASVSMGAYSTVCGSSFNGFGPARVVLVTESEIVHLLKSHRKAASR